MKYLLTLGGLLSVWLLAAQARTEMGLSLGAANYLGDLETEDHAPNFDLSQFAAGLYVGKNLSSSFQFRGQLLYAPLAGQDALQDDPGIRARNFSFTNSLLAGEVLLLWEPFAPRRYPAEGGYRTIVSPYFFSGFGVARSAPETRYGVP
ncbi:MAG: hypothetical protein D6772_04335, partial [Bacteroidetes bacterium]